MSRAASPGTGLVYGLERVCAVWGVPRSSFYAEQRKAVDPTKPAARRRGPKPKISDENLLAAIAADLEASPFEGEGFRKVWARLRVQQGIRVACENALAAAREAQERLSEVNRQRPETGSEALAFGLGWHVGDVLYGNTCVPERLEFSVTEPAANEAARIEDLTKSLGHRVVVSANFAGTLAAEWRSLGRHEPRGVGDAVEVFSLDDLR